MLKFRISNIKEHCTLITVTFALNSYTKEVLNIFRRIFHRLIIPQHLYNL